MLLCSPCLVLCCDLTAEICLNEVDCLSTPSAESCHVVQALSNTVWAFSKLEVLDEELFDAIAKEATGKLPRFNAQNIANTVRGTPAYRLEH